MIFLLTLCLHFAGRLRNQADIRSEDELPDKPGALMIHP